MAGRNYGYQYDTNPRKIKPEYQKKTVKKKKPVVKKSEPVKKENIKKKYENDNIKKAKPDIKSKVYLAIKCGLIFVILFLIIFRNSQVNESFAKIQELKAKITNIQKEKDQLEVSIQNSINLNNIELAAKEKLGMQKRTAKQTIYINLSKKDYVEPKSEKIILEENNDFWTNLWEKITNIF